MKTIENTLLIIDGHPVFYKVGIWREFTKKFPGEVEVLFLNDISMKKHLDMSFKVIRDDSKERLLNGYSYRFSKNTYSGFLSRINLDLFFSILKSPAKIILIHGYDSFASWLAFFTCKLLRRKIIWRGEAVINNSQEESKFFKSYAKKIMLKIMFRCVDVVMWSCSGNKNYLLKYGVNKQKLFPIPCAVDNDFFQYQKKKISDSKDNIRLELNIAKDDYVVLFSARFSNIKRPYDLIEAVGNIGNQKIVILFVGDGDERVKMEEIAKTHKIRFKFVGFQDRINICKYYSIADLGIVISSYDPSPKALNEMMNFAIPVIATKVIGTAYDLVEEGKNGYLIDVGDVNELADRISYLSQHRSTSTKMGKFSLKLVEKWNYKEDVKGLRNAIDYIISRDV